MFSYITQELPNLVGQFFRVDIKRMSITGFQMGGHGALVCALRNPGLYKSVSALSPITNPLATERGR
jgi:S-formylglutathione hydrolase